MIKKDLKILVVGCGSIGKRHIRNAVFLGIDPLNIVALDTRDDRIEEVINLGVKNVKKNFNKALKEDFDVAIICSPTSLHLNQSLELAKKNKHLLIEKPLDSKLDGADELQSIVNKNKLTCMIA